MDRIINYLLLTIIFVFDPLAIALVVAANFAFERIRPKTRENLYGETVECSVPEGREFNTPYDLDDLIPDTPYTEEEVSEVLKNEVDAIGHNNFYLSGVMMNNGPIRFNAGSDIKSFDENKVLNEYQNYNHYDFQGSTWAPHLLHRDLWEKVGGFSEEFFPGTGSDPDLNMKLWKEGVRIFKGVNNCKVYHFGSIVTRKYKNHPTIITESGSKGGKIFLLKWGMTIKFFKKFYLRSDQKYDGPLNKPVKNLNFFIKLMICKLNYIYLKLIDNFKK